MSGYNKSKRAGIKWILGIIYLYVLIGKKTLQLLVGLRKIIYQYARSGLISRIRIRSVFFIIYTIYQKKNIIDIDIKIQILFRMKMIESNQILKRKYREMV